MHKIVSDTIDGFTGELTGTTVKIIKRKKLDRFVMFYIENIELLMKLKSATAFKLYLLLVKRMERDSNLVQVTSHVKIELIGEAGCTLSTYTNIMKELILVGLISRVSRGTYRVMPHVVFNGSQIEREKMV